MCPWVKVLKDMCAFSALDETPRLPADVVGVRKGFEPQPPLLLACPRRPGLSARLTAPLQLTRRQPPTLPLMEAPLGRRVQPHEGPLHLLPNDVRFYLTQCGCRLWGVSVSICFVSGFLMGWWTRCVEHRRRHLRFPATSNLPTKNGPPGGGAVSSHSPGAHPSGERTLLVQAERAASPGQSPSPMSPRAQRAAAHSRCFVHAG